MQFLNFLKDKIEDIRWGLTWKIEDLIWLIKNKISLDKELKCIDFYDDEAEEIEVKAKKKKKKNVKKTKKNN